MSMTPRSSPWGEIQHCEKLIEGVFLVSTAGHGGVMVHKNVSSFLSPEAQELALNNLNYLCYEEDCDEAIVIRELLDKKMWILPDRISDKAGYEEVINHSLVKWHPEYWEVRQKRLASLPDGSGEKPELMPDVRNEIIFRDANYHEKFRIKDGERIKITVAYDGEEVICKCRWLDEMHMNVGSTCYHTDEFMEKLTKVGNKYEPIPNQESVIDVIIAESGKPPRDAEIPTTHAALHNIIGGKPEIVSSDKFHAVVKGIGGNGTAIVCGIKDGNLTSLHPYVAQMQKRELIKRSAEENKNTSLVNRLEAGKIRAASHIIMETEKSANTKRHAEVG